MRRHTTFSFTLLPSREQEQALKRHVGAARFAFNQCLRLVTNALGTKQQRDRSAAKTQALPKLESRGRASISSMRSTPGNARKTRGVTKQG